ncbi:MAG: winged helix-turn-helix domain-containing protein [Gemmatimonadota bacterium]
MTAASAEDTPPPLTVVVLKRSLTGARALGALRDDPRFELIEADERKTNWISGAQRASAVLVATGTDPLSALLFVITAGVTTPILVAAPRRMLGGRRDVLEAGAAACLTTPLTRATVTRMVKLLTKQTSGLSVDAALHLVLDPISRVVRLHGKSVRLSQREFAVLHCLTSRRGRPVSAYDIMAYVWGERSERKKTREILDVYIHAIRRKLKRLGLAKAIRTVRGYGYALADGPSPR